MTVGADATARINGHAKEGGSVVLARNRPAPGAGGGGGGLLALPSLCCSSSIMVGRPRPRVLTSALT